MKTNYKYSIFFLIIFLYVLQLPAQTGTPGLYEQDGTPHPVHEANPVTGSTINVVDFGADPLDSDVDDRPSIELALQSAESGDEIYFPAGTFNFYTGKPGDTSTHLVLKSGVNLRGAGMDSTILISEFGDETIQRVFKMRGLHDIVISHMTVTSSFDGNYSTDTSINNPDRGGPRYSVSIEENGSTPCYNITVDSLMIEKFWRMGVRLSNSHDVVIKNTLFQNATDVGGGGAGYGISLQGNGDLDTDSRHNLIENCQFMGPYMRHGVVVQYATHNNLLQYNYAEANQLDALDLHGEDEYLNELCFNEVRNVTRGAGVGVGNTGSTHDASGPFNYIHNNTFVNCREGVKVYLGSPDTRIENNIIFDTMVSSGKGIYLLNAPRTIVKGNIIRDNAGSSFAGIYLQYDGGTEGKGIGEPRDIQIIENEIYNNTFGIRIYDGTGIVMYNNQVYNNSVTDIYVSSQVVLYNLLTLDTMGSGSIETDSAGPGFPVDSEVMLTAMPQPNWQFDHWEGDLSGNENPITLVMDDFKDVTAVFTEKSGSDEVMLTIAAEGQGNVIIDPPGGVYDRGDTVTVTAIADSAYKFVEWSGDLSGSNVCDTLIMDQNKSISAVFEAIPVYSLAAWIIGKGHVEYNPPGGSYLEGQTVIINAVPDEGWQFMVWGGAMTGSQNPDTLIINSDMGITVTFEIPNHIDKVTIIDTYKLFQNYPNPFNASTKIDFDIPVKDHVKLTIWDALGREIIVLTDQVYDMGHYSINWNGIDSYGNNVPTGVYFTRIETANYNSLKKILLIK